jgi:DNA-binding CsgD family transcriptional regulator
MGGSDIASSGKGPESESSKRKIKALQRERDALEMRIGGASARAIAEQLGITERGARKAIRRAMDRIKDEIRGNAEDLYELQLERLDKMLLAVWSDAIKGRYGAVDRVLRIESQRAKLLGLDAPTQVSITWQTELLQLIESGDITLDEAREELGDDLANEFFAAAGIRLGESGEVEAESGENPLEPASA